jgi:hypothetical protein
MWSLNSFSQVDTTYTCLPNKVLREVAKDLIRYDGCREELAETQLKLEKVLERETFKDTVISLYTRKDYNNQFIIRQQELQINQYEKLTHDLTKEVESVKNENIFWKVLSALGAIITTIAIVK